MQFETTAPGVVTLFSADLPRIDCLMSPLEPLCYDALCDLLPDGARAAEVGSFKGGSAVILSAGMRRRGKELVLACHDLFTPFEAAGQVHDIETCFDAHTAAWGARPVKVKGDSKATHRIHQDGSLDYVFIDGDHSYEGALADIVNFAPKLRAGGFLAVQDSIGEVKRAVEEAMADLPRLEIRPPIGHYITVACSDRERLDAYRDALRARIPGASR